MAKPLSQTQQAVGASADGANDEERGNNDGEGNGSRGPGGCSHASCLCWWTVHHACHKIKVASNPTVVCLYCQLDACSYVYTESVASTHCADAHAVER